jgi:DNA-binding helix-turn-helix protein
VVGDLELTYEVMELPSNRDWFVFAFTAEPGSPSQVRLEALKELCDLADGKPGEIAEMREARAEPLPED